MAEPAQLDETETPAFTAEDMCQFAQWFAGGAEFIADASEGFRWKHNRKQYTTEQLLQLWKEQSEEQLP